eukprot:CAMPEP_0170487072 /NCGR_PEP_ID=MMETSP0208-20121228/5938_1 /TAXON_ID=197538 /ORGANISM="Strombidium inclinatum, Strain S3" /LENGTH=91 /DNA_ID=CAMNT_0010761207 /DNA_START=2607 /DNA_END=2882 /DNA_ORIENTATION=-
MIVEAERRHDLRVVLQISELLLQAVHLIEESFNFFALVLQLLSRIINDGGQPILFREPSVLCFFEVGYFFLRGEQLGFKALNLLDLNFIII